MADWRIINADVIEGLRGLEDQSVQTCITSPPYWGLRDYGEEGQLGLESTPEEYVERIVQVYRSLRPVLKDNGTVWLVIGDSFATGGGAVGRCPGGGDQGERFLRMGHINTQPNRMPIPGLKPKDLCMIPARVALALQADGWWLRMDIVWDKPNPMPESVTDRPTKSHEYIFLLSKSAKYYYDADAIREPFESSVSDLKKMAEGKDRIGGITKEQDDKLLAASKHTEIGKKRAVGNAAAAKEILARKKTAVDPHAGGRRQAPEPGEPNAFHELGRNKRSVWRVATQPYPEAHFAVYPTKLITPCVLAGTAPADTVLDPFCGSGTTGVVALAHGRNFIGIELSEEYCEMARKRIDNDLPLFNRKPEEE